MALISEPAGGRDFRERQSRGYQEPLRVLNASLQEPAVRSLPGRPLEGTSEVSNGQMALTCEASQSHCFIQAFPQDLLSAPYLPRRQTAAGQAMLYPSHLSMRVRMRDGDAYDFGDLLLCSTRPDGGRRVRRDAVVAVQGQGDREGEQALYLRAKQTGHRGRTPEHVITVYGIWVDPVDCRRVRGSTHGTSPVDFDVNGRLIEAAVPVRAAQMVDRRPRSACRIIKRLLPSAMPFQKTGPVQIVRVYWYLRRYADALGGEWLCEMMPMPGVRPTTLLESA